jgi:hypothetical protein
MHIHITYKHTRASKPQSLLATYRHELMHPCAHNTLRPPSILRLRGGSAAPGLRTRPAWETRLRVTSQTKPSTCTLLAPLYVTRNILRISVVSLLVVGCWLLVVGCWLLVVGCWLLVVGCWLLVVGCGLLVVGCGLLVVGCGLLVVVRVVWWMVVVVVMAVVVVDDKDGDDILVMLLCMVMTMMVMVMMTMTMTMTMTMMMMMMLKTLALGCICVAEVQSCADVHLCAVGGKETFVPSQLLFGLIPEVFTMRISLCT